MKSRLTFVAALLGSAAFSTVAQAQSESASCAGELGAKSNALDLIFCVRTLALELDQALSEMAFLQERLSNVRNVPSGAVMAFDRRGECPDGWSDYTPGAGRVIIGTGAGNFDPEGNALTERELGKTGGFEAIKLELEHMPSHSHALSSGPQEHVSEFAPHNGFAGSNEPFGLYEVFNPNPEPWAGGSDNLHEETLRADGGDAAHNNMPPYIALNLCKKD